MKKLALLPLAVLALAACGDDSPVSTDHSAQRHMSTTQSISGEQLSGTSTVRLTWHKIANATDYQIQIGNASGNVVSKNDVAGTPVPGTGHVYADFPNIPAGTYTARVKSQGNSAQNNWIESAAFTVVAIATAPSNSAPANVDFTISTGATEGSAVSFSGSATDADGDLLSYSWSFGATSATASHTYADNGTYSVTLTVSDGKAQTSATKSVTVSNAAPVVTAAGNAATVVSGTAYTFGGSFSDAGVNDNPWSTSINWGDGSAASTGSTSTQGAVSGTHTFYAATGRTIVLTVTDKDGGSGSAAGVSITVLRRTVSIQVNPRTVKVSQSSDKDMMSVRIFGASDFAASTAVVSSVQMNGATAVRGAAEDVNADGIMDLVVHFRRVDVSLGNGAMTVVGDLANGTQFRGTDVIRIIP